MPLPSLVIRGSPIVRRQLKKGGNPAWLSWAGSPKGNGGNPEGSPSLDVTVTSATSAASEESEDSEDVRRKLPGKGVEKSGNAWAQKGEKGPTSVDDSVTSGTSATSAVSVESDDERRKLPGNGNAPDWAGSKGDNPNGSSGDVTVTSATSAASEDSGTSATSAASAESEASVDSSAE